MTLYPKFVLHFNCLIFIFWWNLDCMDIEEFRKEICSFKIICVAILFITFVKSTLMICTSQVTCSLLICHGTIVANFPHECWEPFTAFFSCEWQQKSFIFFIYFLILYNEFVHYKWKKTSKIDDKKMPFQQNTPKTFISNIYCTCFKCFNIFSNNIIYVLLDNYFHVIFIFINFQKPNTTCVLVKG